MMSNRSNSFGSFLQVMNSGRPDAPAAFDREGGAKQMLSYLSDHGGPVSQAEVGRALGLTDGQCGDVVAYLHDAGMIEKVDETTIRLSGFGGDAMGMFAVS